MLYYSQRDTVNLPRTKLLPTERLNQRKAQIKYFNNCRVYTWWCIFSRKYVLTVKIEKALHHSVICGFCYFVVKIVLNFREKVRNGGTRMDTWSRY